MVAVVTSSGLEIASRGGAVPVAGPGAASPAWAPNGEALAYLDRQPGRLWLSDRAGHTKILLDQTVISFAWSPAGALLAAEPIQGGVSGGLLTVDTAGRVTTLVASDFLVSSYEWSPDARSIAYAEAFPAMSAGPASRTDRLYVRTLASPAPTLVPYDPGTGNGIILAAWWPNQEGLYLWSDPQHSSSIAADGLELAAVSLPDGHPTSLRITLPLPEVLAFSPDGAQVVIMSGGSRFINESKSLVICGSGAPACSDLLQPGSTVSVEPSWSPDGRTILFIRGAATQNVDSASWLPTTRLYLYDVTTAEARSIPNSPSSVGYPRFTPDGRQVIFQHDTDLSILTLATGSIRQVATGLPAVYSQWAGTSPYAWAG